MVAFSKAVDHYDRKENTEVKEELVIARRIDPDNEAVQAYLSKLIVNLSKFKIEAAAMQLPSQNPAYLGILQYAQVSAIFNMPPPAMYFTLIITNSNIVVDITMGSWVLVYHSEGDSAFRRTF